LHGTSSIRGESHEQCVQLIERGEYERALSALQEVLQEDASGEMHALSGLAFFRLQDYPSAESSYHAALERQPDNADWAYMHCKARANAESRVALYVPEPETISPAVLTHGALPTPPPNLKRSLSRTSLLMLGNGLGAVAAGVMKLTTECWGKAVGYRDQVWTNWYRRPLFFAVLTLAYMRDKLNRENLRDAYPPNTRTGFHTEPPEPPPGVSAFRTANGCWNNLANPLEGAAGTRFSRNVATAAIRPETGAGLMTPNPRELSLRLLSRHGPMKEVPFLNLLAASWIQFQTHDWVSHGENMQTDFYEIPLEDDDPARRRYRQTKMFVGKTQTDPTHRASEPNPRTHLNEVTHWWDGSQIYGSDEQTASRLRTHVDGKLEIHGDTLPLTGDGVEDTGFNRNWWVGLSMLHTLFVKEHNAICDRLSGVYADWNDDRLYQVSRLVNAAVMAKIHTVEWTPAILPNRVADTVLNANWYGLATNFFRRREYRKTLSEINIRNPEIGGVVGNPTDDHGVPYSLSEEFVEVYRLHSLLPETLAIRHHNDGSPVEEVPLASTRQSGSPKLVARAGMTDLFYSFGNQHPGALELNNYPRFMQELSVPGNPLLDLGAVDILRARERGVPRYNEFRQQLGLKRIRCFGDLTDDSKQVAALEELYGGNVDSLDLLIGTLAEATSRRPTRFGFGETLFQIFILNATRRLQADRFYTSCYNAATYTPEGLDWVDSASLKTVLLRHYPALVDTGLANITNAFEPWDTGSAMDPERHPLRRR
jgi:hypothetical protein